jgi:hypothetical protein
MPQLDVGTEQEPIGAGLSERHPYTTGIHDASFSDPSIELHVGVAADDQGYAESLEER